MGHQFHFGFPAQPGNQIVGALSSRTAGTVGNAHVGRSEPFKIRDGLKELLPAPGCFRRKELEAHRRSARLENIFNQHAEYYFRDNTYPDYGTIGLNGPVGRTHRPLPNLPNPGVPPPLVSHMS